MSKDLGSFKKTRSAADASMLTNTHRKAIEALTYSQRTALNKPVFYYNFGSLIAGPSSLFTLERVANPAFAGSSFVDITPTYVITQSVTSVNEGADVTFTVTTTNVADGTVLYWTNSGTTTDADFSDGQNSGSVTITSGSGTITRTLLLDAVASESETVILQLRTGSVSGTVVATSGTVGVIDKTAVYAVTESTVSVNEGSSVTFTVTTANVADGTTLYWTISGTAVAADFSDDAASGSFTVTSGTGSIVRTIKSDLSTEGTQTFTLSVRTGSISGTVVATSNTVTINDTSVSIQYTWTEVSTAPSQSYNRIDITSNFTTQIATRQSSLAGAQGPYISTDNGATWTRKINGITLLTNGASYTVDVAVASANGLIMYAAQRREFVSTLASTYDKIYRSTDTGDNWTAISPADSTWQSITCSSDGQIVLAGNSNSGNASYDRKMAYSTNGGSTWSIASPSGQWTSLAMSSDGTRMYAVATGVSNLSRSSDTGATWTTTAAGAAVNSVACSSNGLIVLITRGSSAPMVSTNGGVNLSAVSGLPSIFWGRCAVSDNGTTMVVVSNSTAQRIYISTDSGTTWNEQTGTPSTTWSSAAINSDGSKIIVGPSGNAKPYIGIPPV